ADVPAPVGDPQDLGAVAPALARLARDVDVLEEVHLELLEAVPLARLAAPTGNVEGEGPGREAKGPGLGLGGEQLADLVERLDVGDGVRARSAADRLLIDQPHASQVLEALQRVVRPRRRELDLEGAGHR